MRSRMFFNRGGFTLVELLIVIAIISMLAMIALPNFEEAQTRSKVSAVKNNMRTTATKLEMLQVDSNRYPLAGKWRWLLLWRVLADETEDPKTEFMKRMSSLYGAHWDIFEWEALKRNAIQDTEWMANQNRSYLYHGFNFFSPPTMVSALQYCILEPPISRVQWEDSALRHWEAVRDLAGDWLLVSPGPDLTIETPAWIEFPCRPQHFDLHPEGYTERGLFTEYDPTNGSVSYGNIFRTHKNPGGLRADGHFWEAFGEEQSEGVAAQEL
ncbi:MAG: type IV pilin protein [Candidatus Sumerlaeaceae bacterium]